MSGGLFYKLNQTLAARKDLTASAKVLYAVVVDRIGRNRTCWAGVRTLADDCGVSVGTIIRATAAIEKVGLLHVKRRVDKHSRQVNLYSIPGPNATETEALPTGQAPPKRKQSASKTAAKAPPKQPRNQTDPLTRPKRRASRKPTTNPQINEFIDWFCGEYQMALGRAYVVTGGKDGGTVKQLLRSLSVDEMKQAARNMLSDDWGRERASIGLLASQINSWRGGKRKPTGQTSSFTPAQTDGTDYGDLAQRF